MKNPKQFRQGDILFVEVSHLPADAKRLASTVVAEGEVTGHMHCASPETAELYEDGNVKFLKARAEASIVHEEHKTIVLPAGVYKVVHQREYVPDPLPKTDDPTRTRTRSRVRTRRVRD